MGEMFLDSKFFKGNRNELSELVESRSVILLNSNDEMPRNGDQFYSFRQSSDFYYLTGINQEKSILLMCPDHTDVKMREILSIRKPDKNLELWEGDKLTVDEARNISGISNIKSLFEFESVFREYLLNCNNVYYPQTEFPKIIPEFPDRNLRFIQGLKKDWPNINFRKLSPFLNKLRLIKKPCEIDTIKRSCEITHKAFQRTLKVLEPGMMEFQVEAGITYEFMMNGIKSHAYHPIIASGERAYVLHYTYNNRPCDDGDLLLMDFGSELNNYAADCSRTIPVNGRFSKRQKECYEAVLRVFKKLKALYIPGNTINIINSYANKWMEEEMIGLGLFTQFDVENQLDDSPLFRKYFMHGTAHFIGLDVHDVGDKDVKFKKGMVLTCEPGIYIRDEKIGIRIENDILIDEKPIDLMDQIPIEVEEIELLMKK